MLILAAYIPTLTHRELRGFVKKYQLNGALRQWQLKVVMAIIVDTAQALDLKLRGVNQRCCYRRTGCR